MKVLGFGEDGSHNFQILVEQPFIQGKRMSDDEIQTYAIKIGFELKNPRNWTFASPNIYLSDLHDENVILSEEGTVFVVDCDIRINTPELHCGGMRSITNEIVYD